MPRTFEELAAEEMDALYQGALFLCGGNPRAAEIVLVDTLTLAFRDHEREPDAPPIQHWLEGRMVRAFVRRTASGPPPLPPSGPRNRPSGRVGRIGTETLFKAAAAVPPWPRAAIWLVLLRRWGYQEAAAVLGVARDVLRDLLRYRDHMMSIVLRSSGRRNGTHGDAVPT